MFNPQMKRDVALRLDVSLAEKTMLVQKAKAYRLSMTQLIVLAVEAYGRTHRCPACTCPIHALPRNEQGLCPQCDYSHFRKRRNRDVGTGPSRVPVASLDEGGDSPLEPTSDLS
jgi:hypothetical protein